MTKISYEWNVRFMDVTCIPTVLGCIWVGNYGIEEVYEDRMVA